MRNELQLFDLSAPLGSEEAYITRVNAIPLLTAEEELQYATAWFHEKDVEAARRLTLAHLRFVVKIANGYMGYGLSKADLIQEGNVGLMKAVKRFDPTLGVRLVSFAVHWIKAEMHEFILRNWRIVKVATTKAQRKLFFNLRSMRKRLGWATEAEIHSVACALGVKPAEVRDMEARLNAHDTSFDLPSDTSEGSGDEGGSRALAPVQYLTYEASLGPAELILQENWEADRFDRLEGALEVLSPRDRDIVKRRWLVDPKATLQDLAKEYGISLERVRQLEARALSQLKKQMSLPALQEM
jgi:RNA polymerase sigma-32 factor